MSDRIGGRRDGNAEDGRGEGTVGVGRGGAVGTGPEGGASDRDRSGEPLDVVRPDWHAPDGVKVLCTTRAGGVSEPPYDALNLGLHVGDERTRVRENRRLLAERLALPSSPTWLAQVHGTRVVEIDGSGVAGDVSGDVVSREVAVPRGLAAFGEVAASASEEVVVSGRTAPDRASGDDRARDAPARNAPVANDSPASPEADGAWTARRGVVLAVLTADCLPVVIADDAGTRVAVAHAGWRGLAGGVLDAALAAFPPGETLHVWLGPAIGPRAFEVGEEVREAFVGRDVAHAGAFVLAGTPGKFLADLYALARGELQRARGEGVHVSGGERCTVSEPAHFHSHRRDGVRSGRMATLAWLR